MSDDRVLQWSADYETQPSGTPECPQAREIGDELVLIDHGGGADDSFLRTGFCVWGFAHGFLRRGRRATEVSRLFLSHPHTDHCLDYARLVHSRWDQGAGQIPDLTVHADRACAGGIVAHD